MILKKYYRKEAIYLELFKLFGTILINNDKANQSIHKTDQQAQQSGNKISSSFKKIGAAVGAFLSVKAIKDFGSACIDAYKVQAEAELKLETIMKQRFNATNESIQSIKDLTSAQQRLGVVGDEVQMAGAQQLSTFLGTDEALKSLIPAMNNLAVQQNGTNVTSEKMVTIGNMMGKVMQGQTSALSRVGITFTSAQEKVLKYGNEQERAAMLAEIITDNVGNMNEEFAKTDAGKIQQAKNNFGDLQEVIGSYLLPVVADFYNVLNVITVFLLDNLGPSLDFIGSLLSGLGSIFTTNTTGMSEIWALYGQPIFDALSNTVNVLVESWGVIWPPLQNLFLTFWSMCQVIWQSVGKPIFDIIIMIALQCINFFNENWPTIARIISEVFDNISRFWNEILKPVFEAIKVFIENILKPIFAVVFADIFSSVQASFNKIVSIWDTVLKPILNGIIDFVSGIFSGNWSKAWNGITSILTGIWNGVKSILWSPIQYLIDKVSSFSDIITGPFREAAGSIGSIWSAIKSVFKLPHFTMNGSWNPLDWLDDGLPSFGVEWYAKGGLMTGPTAFGINPYSGKMMVGGEAGDEAIAPISKLEEYYKKWSNEGNSEMLAMLREIRDYLADDERWYRIMLRALKDGSFAVMLDGREIGRIVRKYA